MNAISKRYSLLTLALILAALCALYMVRIAGKDEAW